MNEQELKPCPFCGGDADIVRGDDIHGKKKWYKVYCKCCQNRTWENPKRKDAITRWNTRTLAEQQAKRIESLEKALEDCKGYAEDSHSLDSDKLDYWDKLLSKSSDNAEGEGNG